MPARVTLSVMTGKLHGQSYHYSERTTCILGRAPDCTLALPDDKDHKAISRHHCLLDINPPDIRVRDFGSLNGTYVNGKKIGQRSQGQTPEEGAKITFPEFDLKDGDEIELGDTLLRVGTIVPAVCGKCGVEVPEDQKAAAQRPAGDYVCEACRFKTISSPEVLSPTLPGRFCAQCGKDVSGEIGENRHGDFVCLACQADPGRIARQLLNLADRGDPDCKSLKGYSIVKELGRGGMGAVFLIRHASTDDQVALKIMLPKVVADERAKQLFLREGLNTGVLQHRNVVWLRDAGCSHGAFFLTLEYCDGGSVDHLQKGRGRTPLSLAEVAPIILQALDGLEYSHNIFGLGNGLVHRDLKPHNLFLVNSGPRRVVKVGDYGLAKAFDLAGLSGLTCSGAMLGTPVFMPRQQVINFKYAKPEVDVWATAASFYYLLTGCCPRDFPQGMEWWLAVLQNDAIPIRKRNAGVPKKLAAVIDHALVETPAIGFQTASALRRAIEGSL
jgi:hypothetical protein